ncbi:TPA: hypothetical protein ACH3X3_008986 [Trebouxia sp. C0006]
MMKVPNEPGLLQLMLWLCLLVLRRAAPNTIIRRATASVLAKGSDSEPDSKVFCCLQISLTSMYLPTSEYLIGPHIHITNSELHSTRMGCTCHTNVYSNF